MLTVIGFIIGIVVVYIYARWKFTQAAKYLKEMGAALGYTQDIVFDVWLDIVELSIVADEEH